MESQRPKELYKNDLALLHELALVHNLHVQFDEMGEEGPQHRPTFHMEVRVGDFVGYGSGPSKQQAKLNAASKVVKELKKLPLMSDISPTKL
uniref:DRBM domain-containing protein n=1 Tax=Periophthalmus magnuspinnatus TaxID=409849 RepID=A0A3B4B6K2_9GOBI